MKNPQVWWPVGHGKQLLYNLNLTVNSSEVGVLTKSVQIGIRNVTFIKSPFHFKINGYPIYMKGANQVPMDYYPSRMHNKTEVKWFLDQAVKANLNILRIWGGGMYMSDYFYEYADRIGLMIWHDMMFSCRFYPYTDIDYVTNSVLEVRE